MKSATEMRDGIISAANGPFDRASRESSAPEAFEAKAVDELLSRAVSRARGVSHPVDPSLSYGCVDWFLYPQAEERPASAA